MLSTHVKELGYGLVATLLATATQAVNADSFNLTSPDLGTPPVAQERFVFSGFGCEGGNLSPSLTWTNPPEGTRSFALTLYDPDAPTGSGWWHWVTFNLPATTRHLPTGAGNQGALPDGAVQGRTDYGAFGYGGPCPPVGDDDHRYQFRLFALDIESLELPEEASAALVGFMLNQHAIDVAELEFTYGR